MHSDQGRHAGGTNGVTQMLKQAKRGKAPKGIKTSAPAQVISIKGRTSSADVPAAVVASVGNTFADTIKRVTAEAQRDINVPTIDAVKEIAARIKDGAQWTLDDTLAGIRCYGMGERQKTEVVILMSRAFQVGYLGVSELNSAYQIEREKDYGKLWLFDFQDKCRKSSITVSEFIGKLSPEQEGKRKNRNAYLTVKAKDNGGALELVIMERQDPNAEKTVDLAVEREKVLSAVGKFLDAVSLKVGNDTKAMTKAFDLLEASIVERIDIRRDQVAIMEQTLRDLKREPDNTGARQ